MEEKYFVNLKFCVFLTGWLILPACPLRHYYFVDKPLTWSEAQTYCRQKYTDLATIENAEEVNQLRSLLSSVNYASDFWIGLYAEINWKWSDGLTWSGAQYHYWRHGIPTFRMGNLCVIKLRRWFMRKCTSENPFYCYRGKDIHIKIALLIPQWGKFTVTTAPKKCVQSVQE
uniref:C-type lectin domain-containing protein n=1 Tax=Stegastes partitus TaxID=144197 RepID=A0A3B4Z4B1_9TELE